MVGIVFDDIFLKHKPNMQHHGYSHPERPERLVAIKEMLQKEKLFDKLKKIPVREATHEELKLNHTEEHINLVAKSATLDASNFDEDTYACKDSYQAAKFAVGGLLNLTDHIIEGKISSGFAFIRPPGHHAEKTHAMGFCLFNNIAIAAKYLITKHKLNRVLILDFDVHHGNGTQNSFYNDPKVFFISLHQFPHYPGTGNISEIGEGDGKNFTLNIPMKSGSGDKEYLDAFANIIPQRVNDFKPEFILVSAGFDGHRDDPLSSINLTDDGYKNIAKILNEHANKFCNGKIAYVLEGGYNLDALAKSIKEVITSLMSSL